MNKLIQLFSVAVLLMLPVLAQAQTPVTVKDLNTYDNLTTFSEAAIQAQALAGKEVVFTAVIVSNPKSSGLSTPSDTNNDGVIDRISRMHVFVTDTTAITAGRDGMSMQLVATNLSFLDSRVVGDIITVKGKLAFFNAGAQFNASDIEHVGNIHDPEYTHLAPLIEPWVVPLSELVTKNPDGTFQANIANYPKYHAAYVKIEDATVSNVLLEDRPNWAINKDGFRMYVYDTSLRIRNDRKIGYLPGWNYRRIPGLEGGEDGLFVPPTAGALVNVSGFMILNSYNNDGHLAPNQIAFKINPMEDGVLWLQDESGNDVRCVDGGECFGEPFEWINDIEVIGLPPVVSNVVYPDSTVKTTATVVVKADVAAEEGKTLSKVEIVYTSGDSTLTSAMTLVSGNTYEFTMPTYPEFTPVTFYILTEDNEGLVGRNPLNGTYGYYVADDIVRSITQIQKTGDGKTGPSPLLGQGVMDVELTGLIVSDNNDGVIILQEAAAKWSGIFLEKTTETKALLRGDKITITKAEVVEASVTPVQNAGIGLTQLTNLEFTKSTSGNDIEAVIPVVATDEVVALTDKGELEPYEGMVLKFENVKLAERLNFDEYLLRNVDATKEGGVIFNNTINSPEIGSVDIPAFIHKTLREDVVLNAYGIVAASFGAPKVHPRNLADLSSETDNMFTPLLDFTLNAPAADAEIKVNGDLEVSWGLSSDLDGDEVTYEFVIYSAADTTEITKIPSNDNSKATEVTVPFEVVDAMLASAGLDIGQSKDFVWNVRVSDGLDTLNVHGSYGGYGDDYFPIYRKLNLERAQKSVSNEELGGTPKEFSLKQNYPNPFNPTTNISFALPNQASVTLEIFDMLGRKVATIVNNKSMVAGIHNVTFDAAQYASGMYIYRIQAGSFTSTRKMMLIK